MAAQHLRCLDPFDIALSPIAGLPEAPRRCRLHPCTIVKGESKCPLNRH